MADSPETMSTDLKNKDAIAYEKMVHLYGERLLKIAYFIVKDHQLAEDVVQESFIALYKNINHFRGESQLSTWLIRITINQAKKSIRSSWFKRVFFPDQLEFVDYSPMPGEALEEKEARGVLQRAIHSLPIIYQEILYLYYFEELKIKEIAEILDIGESGVKSRLKRGREKLKLMIGERSVEL